MELKPNTTTTTSYSLSIEISERDINTLRRIRDSAGALTAVEASRWLLPISLRAAADLIESL